MKRIIPLKPHASHKIWGGSLLAKLRGIEVDSSKDPVGETWEVSAHADGPSTCEYGKLSEFSNLEEIPYLIKLIETSDNLSVQVHPNDSFAKEYENQKGKSECWLILDAEPGEGIYLGVKDSTSKEDFEKSLESKEDLSKLMTFHPVKKGDFFFVPAGTAHAIGKGVFLAEVQQCSDVTYRVWDWNRLDDQGNSRELHIDKAMKVIRFDDEFNYPVNFKIQNNILDHREIKLLELNDFELYSYKLDKEEVTINFQERFSSIFVLSGDLTVSMEGESLEMKSYEAALIPLGENNQVSVKGSGNFLFVK